MTPRALIIAGPGTNRDADAALALRLAGAAPTVALASDLLELADPFAQIELIVIAGGFSYGDALGAGRILALDLTAAEEGRLGEALRRFVDDDGPVIGICNGFQVLTRAGLLPGALGHNDAGHFRCQWVEMTVDRGSDCIWTVNAPTRINCPIAHGEGRYVHPDPAGLTAARQVALRYAASGGIGGNPNGSVADIAGVCDDSGLVLGLMPHPENHVLRHQHPRHRRDPTTAATMGLGLFESGVKYVR